MAGRGNNYNNNGQGLPYHTNAPANPQQSGFQPPYLNGPPTPYQQGYQPPYMSPWPQVAAMQRAGNYVQTGSLWHRVGPATSTSGGDAILDMERAHNQAIEQRRQMVQGPSLPGAGRGFVGRDPDPAQRWAPGSWPPSSDNQPFPRYPAQGNQAGGGRGYYDPNQSGSAYPTGRRAANAYYGHRFGPSQ